MADLAPEAAATTGTTPTTAPVPPEKPSSLLELRAQRRAEYLAKPARPAKSAAPAPAEKAAGAAAAAAAAPAPAEKAAGAAAAAAETTKPDEKDPTTERGLQALERQRKKFIDEQAAAKAELDVQRAEIARLRQDAQGKVTSIDELKKLKPIDVLERLGLSEEDFGLLSRQTYARTKAGAADPKAIEEARRAETDRATRAHDQTLEELRAELSSLKDEFKRRDLAAAQREFASKWVDGALKGVTPDKPSLFSRYLEKSPEKARHALLAIGAELEKTNDGEAPTPAEVLAEFDKRRRAELEELGVDVDALLKPKTATATKGAETKTEAKTETEQKPTTRTIGMGGTGITRPMSKVQARAERRDAWLKQPAKRATA